MVERYTTEQIAPRQRIRRWCEFGSRTLSSLSVDPYEPQDFSARLSRAVVGDLGITEVQTTPAHAVGSGKEVGSWAAGRRPAVLLTLQKAGKSEVQQANRRVTLGPGDVIMWSLGRRWEVDVAQSTVHLSVKIPSERLLACMGDFEPYLASPLRAGDARTELLSAVILGASRLAFASSAAPPSDAVVDLLLSGMQIAFHGGDAGELADDDFRRRVFRFVDQRCLDASVTVSGLAAALGMSLRSFQRVFQYSGMSPRGYILSRRIDVAAEKLRALPLASRAAVTEVAMTSGFNDPGYFGRMFQRRFGMTPGEFRRRHRAVS